MTFRLQGPYPLDLQDVGGSARTAMGDARLAMADRDFSARLRQSTAIGERPGLYLLWDDPDGGSTRDAPALLGFWLTFGPSYVEGGPQEPLDRYPPFAGSLLEALTEEVWWQGLRVTPFEPVPRWRPLFVLEWPAELANRSACPPPGVPTRQNDDRPAEQDTVGFWELDELGETETSMVTPEVDEAEEPALPVARSLVAIVQGDMRLERSEHAASHQLVHLGAAAAAPDAPLPLDQWLGKALAGGSPAPDVEHQAPGDPLALPGDRVGFFLGGWLTAALGVFPGRPGAAESAVLLGRDVGSRWKVQAKTTASVVTTVVVLVLLLAAIVQEFTRPRAHASTAAPQLEAQPALSVCSIDNVNFVHELRCQIKATGANGPLSERVCGDKPERGQESPSRAQPIPDDLQATWCGLRDRDLDGWVPITTPEAATDDQIRVGEPPRNGGYADLVATKACYNVLHHPEDYRLAAGKPQYSHIPNPDRFLEDPVYEVKSLGQLVRELDRRCEDLRPRLERRVEGAVVARHVGANAPVERTVDRQLPEPQQLRQHALIKAGEALPPSERLCLNSGASEGPFRAVGYLDLCIGAAALPRSAAWDELGPKPQYAPKLPPPTEADLEGVDAEEAVEDLEAQLEAADLDAEAQARAEAEAARETRIEGASLVDRYVNARFSPYSHPTRPNAWQVVEQAPDLWKCHMALADQTLPMASGQGVGMLQPGGKRVKWDLLAPTPKAYAGRTVGAVTRQLELDAILTDLQDGTAPDLGACWNVVSRRMVRYRPVHPLLPDRAMAAWPAEEQQLCAQVCASLYRVRQSPHQDAWFTRGTDLGRCVDQDGPETLTQRNRQRAFAAMRVPWNYDRGGTWKTPYPFEVCAFNLVAQGYLTGEVGAVIVDGMDAAQWAGETIDYRVASSGETSAGGLNLRKLGYDRPGEQLRWVTSEAGGAWEAAMNLESYGRARSSSTCGHAATQCFVSQMLASISSSPEQPHRWTATWQERLGRLSSGEGTDDLDKALEGTAKEKRAAQQAKEDDPSARRSYGDRTLATPWCRLVQPYIAGEGGLPEGQLDFPCASGVEQTRQAVEGVMLTLAGSGRASAEEAP